MYSFTNSEGHIEYVVLDFPLCKSSPYVPSQAGPGNQTGNHWNGTGDDDTGGDFGGGGLYEEEHYPMPLEIAALGQEAQDWYNTLNRAEKALCASNLPRCVSAAVEAKRAWDMAKGICSINQRNNSADAYRHAMWQGLFTIHYGYDYASQWGAAHETSSESGEETQMDEHNNEIGRQLGKRYLREIWQPWNHAPHDWLHAQIMQVLNGGMWAPTLPFPPGQLVCLESGCYAR